MSNMAQRRCAICTTPIRFKWALCNRCWREWGVTVDENKNIVCAPWIQALIKEEWKYFLCALRDKAHGVESFDDLTGGNYSG